MFDICVYTYAYMFSMLYYNLCVSCMYCYVYVWLMVMICRTAVINWVWVWGKVIEIGTESTKIQYYENIDQTLSNKSHGPMHYKIGVICIYIGHVFYTLL